MPVKTAKIKALTDELVACVKGLKEFEERAFSIFDQEDLAQKMESQGSPAVAVMYEGRVPKDTPDQATMPAKSVKPTLLYMTVTFSILVGVEYTATADTDTKPVATDLLDAIRARVAGFKGVNGKPWRFVTEQPIGSETRGVIWYGQLWQTDVPQESTSK